MGMVVGVITIIGGFLAYGALTKEQYPLWSRIVGISVIGLGFLTVYEYYVREAFYVNA